MKVSKLISVLLSDTMEMITLLLNVIEVKTMIGFLLTKVLEILKRVVTTMMMKISSNSTGLQKPYDDSGYDALNTDGCKEKKFEYNSSMYTFKINLYLNQLRRGTRRYNTITFLSYI